jgi:uncharacterized membrane protein
MNSAMLGMGVFYFTYAVAVLFISFIPYYIRKDIAFGISVPESEYHNKFFKRLRCQYLGISLLSGVVLAVSGSVTGIWSNMHIGEGAQLIPLVAFLIITGLFYIVFYHRVRKYKKNAAWGVTNIVTAALKTEANERRQFNPLWFLIYLVIIVATVVIAFLRYPSLPDMIPRHYNALGQVDAYASKSMSNLLVIPFTQIVLGVLFFGLGFMILRAKNQTGLADPVEGLKKDLVFKTLSIKGVFLIGFIVMLILGLGEFSMLGLMSPWITAATPIVFLVIIISAVAYFTVRVGQGGSRMGVGKSNPTRVTMDDDSQWILGFFYFNKNDPSVFVERRFGIGWTLNLANPKSITLLIVLIAVLVGMLRLPFILK